jgi:hypothetical protein
LRDVVGASPERLLGGRNQPSDKEILDPEHEAGDEPVAPVGEHETMVTPPVAGGRRPSLPIADLELVAVGALYFGWEQLVPERRVTDHIVNLDIPGPNDVSERNVRTGPLLGIGSSGKVKICNGVEIRHAAIVGMPLLHCLQRMITRIAERVTASRDHHVRRLGQRPTAGATEARDGRR